MSPFAAALVLTGTPIAPAPSVPPAAIGDLQLELETLKARRDAIHWLWPALVTGIGFYAGWTGVEGTVTTAVAGAVTSCPGCGSQEVAWVGVAVGGLLVTAAGVVWLALDFSLRAKLTGEIQDVEQELLERRGAGPAPPLGTLRF